MRIKSDGKINIVYIRMGMVLNLVILKIRVFKVCIILGFIIIINFIYMYFVLKFVLKIQKGMICCEML